MKVHFFDDDPRQITDPVNYPSNHGPFSDLSINFNTALKACGSYSDAESADWVGFNTSLNLNFRYHSSNSFIIHVWETCNALPLELLQLSYGKKIFQSLAKIWRPSGNYIPRMRYSILASNIT